MSAALAERQRYQSPGGMDWRLLPILLAVPALAALAVGWVLAELFARGWYVVPFVSLFGCGATFAAVYYAVAWTHLRSAMIAALVGIAAGGTAFISSYYFSFLRVAPPGLWHRVDFLPTYIKFRLMTDVTEHHPPRPNQQQQPQVGRNYFFFFWELAIYAIAGTTAGMVRAGRPYDVDRSLWAQRERMWIVPSGASEMIAHLLAGNLPAFNEAVRRNKASQSLAECALDFFEPAGESPLACPVYLTIYSSQFKHALRSVINSPRAFRRIELSTQEALGIAPVFPKLQAALAKAHTDLAHIADPGTASRQMTSDVDSSPGVVAEFESLTETERGQISGGSYVWIINLCGLGSLVPGAIGGALVYAAFRLQQAGFSEVLAIALGACGGIGIFATCVLGLFYNSAGEDLYQRRKIRSVLRLRVSPIVAADEPAAFPVTLTPRENWTKIKLIIGGDRGLMLIDELRKEVRYEGDFERFRVPGAAILKCEPERFFHPLDKRTEQWLVRLVVRTAEGMREVLLQKSRLLNLKPATNNRRRIDATDLAARIAALGK